MMNEFHTLWMKRGHSWMNLSINDDVDDDASNDDANAHPKLHNLGNYGVVHPLPSHNRFSMEGALVNVDC